MRILPLIILLCLFSCSAEADSVSSDFTFHETDGVHYSLYVPESHDGSEPYALFITLPGYEGLYFQGEGENLRQEHFAAEAITYNDKMIVAAPQLMDWGERSVQETIELTEYLLDRYSIDRNHVYLEGFSAGGETGSLVMSKRPDLYTAFLAVSTRWDGDLSVLAAERTPVYMAVGERDSYYGPGPLQSAYEELVGIYREQGLGDEEIDKLAVLDIRGQEFFSSHGFSDQHSGGDAFAFDESVMSWLFGN